MSILFLHELFVLLCFLAPLRVSGPQPGNQSLPQALCASASLRLCVINRSFCFFPPPFAQSGDAPGRTGRGTERVQKKCVRFRAEELRLIRCPPLPLRDAGIRFGSCPNPDGHSDLSDGPFRPEGGPYRNNGRAVGTDFLGGAAFLPRRMPRLHGAAESRTSHPAMECCNSIGGKKQCGMDYAVTVPPLWRARAASTIAKRS